MSIFFIIYVIILGIVLSFVYFSALAGMKTYFYESVLADIKATLELIEKGQLE